MGARQRSAPLQDGEGGRPRARPLRLNTALNEQFRDIARAALIDTSLVGHQFFIYPYVDRPITATCSLRSGVNHFLTLGFHPRPHHAEGALPSVLAVYLPRMIFLFSLGDPSQTGDPDFANYTDLRPGTVFHPSASNVNMPEVFAHLINQGILETKRPLSGWGLWGRLHRWLVPRSIIHAVTPSDQQLLGWQRQNCQGHPYA